MGYGLIEFLGILSQKFMRPIWKLPGCSTVNVLVTYIGSGVIGTFVANKLYKEGRYTVKEAIIVLTGFSTVAAPFMLIMARTANIINIFPLYFLVTLIVICIVTAITVRIWPINKLSEEYYDNKGNPEEIIMDKIFQNAWKEAMETAYKAPPFVKSVIKDLKEAVILVMDILPAILSIGLLGLLSVEYTPIFDYLAYIFYPFTMIFKIPDAFLAAKSLSLGVVEVLLPAIIACDAALITRFIVAVVSVAQITFFSTTIPCFLSTEIPVKMSTLLLVFVERTILSILVAHR